MPRKRLYTHEEAISFLKKKQGKDSTFSFARRLGTFPAILRLIYEKKQLPSPAVGFRKVPFFERIDERK
jgi:hypothetical protein